MNVLHEPKIYIDKHCEVHDLLLPIALGDFEDFNNITIRPGAVYVLGRNTMIYSSEKIRSIVEKNIANIVFSNPAEGATTMLGQFERFPTRDLIESGQIMVLSGSPLDSHYRHFFFENFLQRLMNFDENLSCMQRTDEIYNKPVKPFKFLMLNGRMRPHRKWIMQYLRDQDILEQGLYTNLHANNAPTKDLDYIKNNKDLMHDIEPIHYLPAYYEIDNYRDRINISCENIDVKHHLFKNEWGEAYIKPEPYIDTYFSIINETVYTGKNSFRTEKIWKPIIMGHPWICIANSGFYHDLRNLGFQTFEGIIDESFDKISNIQLRIQSIGVIIKDLCEKDLTYFLNQCKSICKYNQQHILEFQKDVINFPHQFVDFIRENIQ